MNRIRHMGAFCLVFIFAPTVAMTGEAIDLKAIMQGLRDNLVEMSDGLLMDDFDQIAHGATGIARHPQIPPAQVQIVAAELGPEMAAFKQLDNAVHDLSLEIITAANALDRDVVISRYQELLEGCLACHSAYKERVAAVLAKVPIADEHSRNMVHLRQSQSPTSSRF